MIVDSSALVEWLLGSDRGDRVASLMRAAEGHLHAPTLVDVEVTHALRSLSRRGWVSAQWGRVAIETLTSLQLRRHPVGTLLPRVWDLRDALSAYDATYVALAEALDMRLLTCDGRLARSRGGSADVHLV